jgi:hypothetical protein
MMAAFVSAGAAAAVTAVLAYASVLVVLAEKQQGRALPVIGIKTWVIEIAMPVALGAMAASYAFVSSKRWNGRIVVVALIAAVFALGLLSPSRIWAWTLSIAILAATLLGSPVFAAMSGLALILFWTGGTPVSAVTAEIFRLVASPTLPAIPLLTACGFILAETQAAHRLVRFFRALLGFLPGGVAVLVGAVCALFTAFTGGSGVTIIALGGLVYPILREDGYPESFSLGLVTAAGSCRRGCRSFWMKHAITMV